jgi:hypothetical protein
MKTNLLLRKYRSHIRPYSTYIHCTRVCLVLVCTSGLADGVSLQWRICRRTSCCPQSGLFDEGAADYYYISKLPIFWRIVFHVYVCLGYNRQVGFCDVGKIFRSLSTLIWVKTITSRTGCTADVTTSSNASLTHALTRLCDSYSLFAAFQASFISL